MPATAPTPPPPTQQMLVMVVTLPKLMQAVHDVEGFPGVTGVQLAELAARLNGIKPKQ